MNVDGVTGDGEAFLSLKLYYYGMADDLENSNVLLVYCHH